MRIRKIVLTGGPSAGKTTGLSWIQNALSKLGYTVLFVPETATELISGGVAPWTCGTNLDYQKGQMRLQLEKEKVFERAARSMNAEKILIVCDRGAMDNRAYMDEREFGEVLSDIGMTEAQLTEGYGAVFHMVTAAKGAEEFYTFENNAARYETTEQARALDDRLIAAWSGHPYQRIIDNDRDFEEKLKRLIAEIRGFLGEPDPLEIKRRYLIAYPDLARLESLPGCRKAEMIQTWLFSRRGEELRLRERREKDSSYYYKTYKRRAPDEKWIEVEEPLSREEYGDLLLEADPEKRPLHKTRYALTYDGRYFEVDVYPFWDDRALLEVELRTEDEELRFPPELTLLRDVTEDERYQNAALAALA